VKLSQTLQERIGTAFKVGSSPRLSQIQFGAAVISKKNVFKVSFHRLEGVGKASFSRYYEFWICPIGAGRLPSRINDYLLDSILIPYGTAYFRQDTYREYGILDAYSLLLGSPEDAFQLIADAIEVSLRLKEDRVVEAATASEKNLRRLSRGDAISEYSPKDFERDVFSVLKRMAPHSERWGREGQRESDGILLYSSKENIFFIASYDPKLSFESEGYDLGAEEKNKAAYYILSEQMDEKVKLLSGGRGIDAHIIVSNRFRDSVLERFGVGVQDWFHLIDSGSPRINVPIIFLPLVMLLEMSALYSQHWELIHGNVLFHQKFFEYISNMLRTREKHLLISSEQIEKLRVSVVELKAQTGYGLPLR
jgi:hypothetical protein